MNIQYTLFYNKKLMRKNFGFTLIEILIALFIFSLIMGMIMHFLQVTQQQRRQTQRYEQEILSTEMTFTFLQNDLLQIINFPLQNIQGKSLTIFLGKKTCMWFTRYRKVTSLISSLTTDRNKKNILPIDLERVAYCLKNKNLYRKVFFSREENPYISDKNLGDLLLTNVKNLSLRYLDATHIFHAQWPITHNSQTLPLAVQIQGVNKDLGKIHQLFVIPAGRIIQEKVSAN